MAKKTVKKEIVDNVESTTNTTVEVNDDVTAESVEVAMEEAPKIEVPEVESNVEKQLEEIEDEVENIAKEVAEAKQEDVLDDTTNIDVNKLENIAKTVTDEISKMEKETDEAEKKLNKESKAAFNKRFGAFWNGMSDGWNN